MIRAILLDLGNVIVPFDLDFVYREIQRQTRLPRTSIRERIRDTGLVPRFESGLIDSRSFAAQFCDALGMTPGYEEFCEIWNSIFLPKTLLSDEFLAALAKQYPLILVSNTNHIHFEMIRHNYPLLKHFKKWILSYKVGAMKPLPDIYQAAVEAAGCAPSECFFTDDIQDYVDAARQFGIDAVQFQDAAQVTQELRLRGVFC